MTIENIVSTLALIVSLSGNVFLNYKKRIGFVMWVTGDILWILFNILGTINYPQVCMYLIYIGLNIHGILMWRNKGKDNNGHQS